MANHPNRSRTQRLETVLRRLVHALEVAELIGPPVERTFTLHNAFVAAKKELGE